MNYQINKEERWPRYARERLVFYCNPVKYVTADVLLFFIMTILMSALA